MNNFGMHVGEMNWDIRLGNLRKHRQLLRVSWWRTLKESNSWCSSIRQENDDYGNQNKNILIADNIKCPDFGKVLANYWRRPAVKRADNDSMIIISIKCPDFGKVLENCWRRPSAKRVETGSTNRSIKKWHVLIITHSICNNNNIF